MRLILIAGAGLVALMAVALTLSTRGNNDDRDPLSPTTREAVAVREVLDVPQAFYRQPVRVDGEVTQLGPEGRFALRGESSTILVDPEPGTEAVREGQRVQVLGTVDRVSPTVAAAVGELGDARTEVGAPFVSAEAVRPS